VQEKFNAHIIKNSLFSKKNKLLVALSGGVDSVVLCHLLKNASYNFEVAHCNFKLRKKASDADENFCRKLAITLGIQFHSKSFNTKTIVQNTKLSVQIAARELRYEWFDQLLREHSFDWLLTAHHAGDNTETVLINLLRGTGIQGLKGIPAKNGKIIRPLLNFTKEQLLEFAEQHKIKYREDASNAEDKYNRNYLRIKVVPLLKQLRPDIDGVFFENSQRFSEETEIIDTYLSERKAALIRKKEDVLFIDRTKLKREKYRRTLLHRLLTPYGFNETQRKNLSDNLDSESVSGKQYFSGNYVLSLERLELVIFPRETVPTELKTIYTINELKKCFTLSDIHNLTLPKSSQLIIEKEKLVFPLLIRGAKTGDKFKPFGMKGFKLVSDFFKDQKFGRQQKKKTSLLINGNGEIIWIIGHRSDERYRVNESSTDIILIEKNEGPGNNI
jgi:tRNA(Ile)-lysidine synthase